MRYLATAILAVEVICGVMAGEMKKTPVKTDRATQFIAIERFNQFARTIGPNGETVLLSPSLAPGADWNELVVSWNAAVPASAGMNVEARAIDGARATDFYNLGLWATDPAVFPRESVPRQKDEDGDVDTDTLILNEKWRAVQLRITFKGKQKPKLRFLALSFLDNSVRPEPLAANTNVWGRKLPVPEKSQLAYPDGGVLCSPTTVSMMLGYWAEKLGKPELARDVPEIVQGVYDRNWGGTGNWVFNMAYAGSMPGMRAYVRRFSYLAEVESLVGKGIPVGLSLCYNRLRGRDAGASGHLVVCVGFTQNGDVVINDPGTTRNVQKIFARERVVDAWAHSKNAAYVIEPR